MGQNRSVSFKPPSSDGLNAPRSPGSLRDRSGTESGGQTGQEGGKLRHAADPGCVLRHEACACGHCGQLLDPKAARGIENRQVFDVTEGPLLVAEHEASIYRCENCRGVTKAAFPDGVVSASQYGERIKAAAVYLNIQQLIPEDRTAQALSDLFGAPLICPASIVAWVRKEGVRAGAGLHVHRRARGEGEGSPSRRSRFRIAGKLQWLHTTPSLTDEKRGAIPESSPASGPSSRPRESTAATSSKSSPQHRLKSCKPSPHSRPVADYGRRSDDEYPIDNTVGFSVLHGCQISSSLIGGGSRLAAELRCELIWYREARRRQRSLPSRARHLGVRRD